MQNIIDNFQFIFSSKEKVQDLRNLVLDLAIKGKIVPQDPNDEPASVLIKKIEEEKKRLIKEKKIKKSKPLPLIKEDEIHFDLPEGWEWIRLGNITKNIHYGYTASATENKTGVKFLRITDIQENKVFWSNVPYCEIESGKIENYQLNNKDILIARTGGTIGKTFIVNNIKGVAVFASYLIRVIPSSYTYAFYIKKFLESPLYWGQLYMKARGSGQPNVNATALGNLMLPLPPFDEQKRIVKKIDELMSFCDELESSFEQQAYAKDSLSKSLSDMIQKSSNKEELISNLTIMINNFKEVYTTTNNIKDLKNIILQLAIQGKLVPQNPNDESASVLIKKIEEEKKRLIKEKKIRKLKPLQPIRKDEIPFELPKGWEWIRLGQISQFINGDRGRNYPSKKDLVVEGIPFVNAGHLHDGKINYSAMNYITEDRFNKLNNGKLAKSDIIYCLRGTLGKSAIVSSLNKGAIASSLMIIRRFGYINVKYLYYYLISDLGKYMISLHDNGTAQPNLSASNVRLYVLPLPPIEEQKRIVEKVDNFIALCDKLEDQISESKNYSEQLMKSVLREIF